MCVCNRDDVCVDRHRSHANNCHTNSREQIEKSGLSSVFLFHGRKLRAWYWAPAIGDSGIARALLSLEVAGSCGIFAVVLRSAMVRCPSASGITHTASSKSRLTAPRIRCAFIVELMCAFTLLAPWCVNIFYSKRVKDVETI